MNEENLSAAKIIRSYIEENCIVYENLARSVGMSRQNLWIRLNKRRDVSFGLILRLLKALGFRMEVVDLPGCGAPGAFKVEQLAASAELEYIGFETVRAVIRACGYDFEIKAPGE